MVFTLVSAAQEWLSCRFDENKLEKEQSEVRRKEAEEEAERVSIIRIFVTYYHWPLFFCLCWPHQYFAKHTAGKWLSSWFRLSSWAKHQKRSFEITFLMLQNPKNYMQHAISVRTYHCKVGRCVGVRSMQLLATICQPWCHEVTLMEGGVLSIVFQHWK